MDILQEEELEQLVADIATGEADVNRLDDEELEQLMDYLHDRAEELIDAGEEEVGERLLKMLDMIGHAIDNRVEAEDNEKFTDAIKESLKRGNFYFELDYFRLH